MSHADREAFEAEVRERADAERAAVTLGAVIAASAGDPVRITVTDGTVVEGVVTDSAAQWLSVARGGTHADRAHGYGSEVLVPHWAIAVLEGPRTAAPEPGPVQRRLSLGHALRALAADGAAVVIHAHGANVRGSIVAVGADYVVVDGTGAKRAVPFAAILTVAAATDAT